MSDLPDDQMYIVKEVPGKGRGLIARKRIPKGTRILSEEPIVRVPEAAPDSPTLQASIRKQVDALAPDQRRAFLSMHDAHASDAASQHFGILQTNALPFGDSMPEVGIFPIACLINHACDNNAQKDWNENIKRHTVHALRDIEEGQEITIYYLGIHNKREIRQERLRRKFGFTCSCRLCSLPANLSQASDEKLDEILKLDHLIGRDGLGGILSNPARILGYVDRQIRLYDEQGPDDAGLPRAFYDAAQIAIANGDLARARIFFERATLGWTIGEGDDSPKVTRNKALVQDLSKHELYGISMKWRTGVNDCSSASDPKDFEDWLWRRETLRRPGQLADFRNRATFPSFIGLPRKNDIDPEFYESIVGIEPQPRRHWCFFAEIVSFDTLPRLQMEIKDVNGMTIPLSFSSDGYGSELAHSQIRKGYTVAILYAQRNMSMISEPGIHIEEPTRVKIVPSTLDNLLALGDKVQQFLDKIR